MEQQRDERLWQTAKARAAFKRNLFTYIVVNLFLWVLWWMREWRDVREFDGIPWPVWVTLGWGLGLAFHYFRAYHGSKDDLAEQEYQRLKQQQKI